MAKKKKKKKPNNNQVFSLKVIISPILAVIVLIAIISVLVFSVTSENLREDRFENVASMTIEQYREIQGTSQNTITRSSSVTNDLIAMDLDPNIFVRFGQISGNRPDIRVVALAEYHFLRENVHQFRKFIYLHVPFRYDTILNNHLRFELNYFIGAREERIIFDTRGGIFGQDMNFIKTNIARGIFVLELDLDFQLEFGTRITEIYSIDRMNATGTLISRNDQTVYMGNGIRMPFRSTYAPLDEDFERMEFSFNSHVFITENTIVDVAPERAPEGQGHLWEGSGGFWNETFYRPHLFFFNFNTTVEIDRILNLRVYFQYQIIRRERRFPLDSITNRTIQGWTYATDSNGQIGRTIENRSYSPEWMSNTNLEFNTITTPAGNRFTDNEFTDFEINRNLFDRYDHSLLIHSGTWIDRAAALGWSWSRDTTEVRDVDITTMTFETKGQVYTARVDITQDTGHVSQVPPPNHTNDFWGLLDRVGEIISNFASWVGGLIGGLFGGLFSGLGPIGTVIFLIIAFLAMRFVFRIFFPKQQRNQVVAASSPPPKRNHNSNRNRNKNRNKNSNRNNNNRR